MNEDNQGNCRARRRKVKDKILGSKTSAVKVEKILPCLVWLSGLSASLQTKRLPVQILVREQPGLQARSLVGGV